jgi:hypothetical protein
MAVERSGFCPACRRVGSVYEDEIVEKKDARAAQK